MDDKNYFIHSKKISNKNTLDKKQFIDKFTCIYKKKSQTAATFILYSIMNKTTLFLTLALCAVVFTGCSKPAVVEDTTVVADTANDTEVVADTANDAEVVVVATGDVATGDVAMTGDVVVATGDVATGADAMTGN